jgi:hypothetical protein
MLFTPHSIRNSCVFTWRAGRAVARGVWRPFAEILYAVSRPAVKRKLRRRVCGAGDAAFFFQLKGARGVAGLTPRENPNDQARRAAARALP